MHRLPKHTPDDELKVYADLEGDQGCLPEARRRSAAMSVIIEKKGREPAGSNACSYSLVSALHALADHC
eukprot:15945106-Heterocapsa_arctica.AAC.1